MGNVFHCVLPKKACSFIFKKSFFLSLFFGWEFLLNMIHINRNAGRSAIQTIINEAPKQFTLGRWLVSSPKGLGGFIEKKDIKLVRQ